MDVNTSQDHSEAIEEDEATLSSLLAASQERLSQLQVQILNEGKHIASIKRKLEVLRRKPPVIHRLPVELLVRIFQALVDEASMNIGKPLLVCKRWYQLLIETPSLWRRIWIEPTWEVDEAPLLKQYVEFALQHSQNLLLDVCIYLEEYELPDNVLREMTRSASTLSRSEAFDSYFWLSRLDEHREFPMIANREKIYHQIFKLLVGNQGEILARWRSFFFKSYFSAYDQNTFLPFFFQNLQFPAPNLEVIDIPFPESTSINNRCFPRISALKKFCVFKYGATTFARNENPSALQELRTSLWHDGLNLSQITAFTNLRRLWLDYIWEENILGWSRLPVSAVLTPFTLPFLEEFHVLGWEKERENAIQVALKAPLLKILSFRWTSPTPYPAFYQVDTLMLISDVESTTRYLETELPLYKNLKRLILSEEHEEGILEWVKEHKDLNPGLRRISSFEVPIAVPSSGFYEGVDMERNFVDEFRYRTHFFR